MCGPPPKHTDFSHHSPQEVFIWMSRNTLNVWQSYSSRFWMFLHLIRLWETFVRTTAMADSQNWHLRFARNAFIKGGVNSFQFQDVLDVFLVDVFFFIVRRSLILKGFYDSRNPCTYRWTNTIVTMGKWGEITTLIEVLTPLISTNNWWRGPPGRIYSHPYRSTNGLRGSA